MLLQCGLGLWAGCDVSSSPRQHFGDDYLFSLAIALRMPYPLHWSSPIAAWDLRECGYLASRADSYIKGFIHTATKLRLPCNVPRPA